MYHTHTHSLTRPHVHYLLYIFYISISIVVVVKYGKKRNRKKNQEVGGKKRMDGWIEIIITMMMTMMERKRPFFGNLCVCGWVFFHLKKSNYIIYLVSFCFVFFLFCFDSFKFPFISSFDRLMATIMMICQLLMMMMML